MHCGKLVLSRIANPTLVLVAICVWQGAAQTIPTIQVYSRETVLDVLVTDDKGEPVRGLDRADFSILEDGKPQPIRSFTEYDRAAPPPPPRVLPPNTFTNDSTLPTSGPVQIFLFDLLGSRSEDIVRSKKYIADYLRTMPDGTQIAVFEFSPSKDLVLLQGFTTDGRAAAQAVDSLNPEWIRNPVEPTPIAIAGMNQIAAYVAGIKGRKDLVWIVTGMPLSILRNGGVADPRALPPDMAYVHRLMDLYDLFTREQIAIYPLDPGGVHGLGPGALRAMEVADATGGTTDNTNDYKSELTKIVNQSSHGYTLSYVPTRPNEDGHFHPIKITVDRPGLHLTYRDGYNDEQPKPPDATLKKEMVQGPMRLGALPATQLLFYFNVESATATTLAKHAASNPSQPHTKGDPYATSFIIDPTQLALIQQSNGTRTVSIELDLGAFDPFGTLVTARSQTFNLTIAPSHLAGFYQRPISFPLAIDLPPGKFTLRAGIFDVFANRAGTLQIPLTVPKKSTTR